jgi:hypothetical protein
MNVNEKLFRRRRDMLRLLSMGNSTLAVFTKLSEEYGVSKAAIRRDYNRMETWLPEFLVLQGVLVTRLDIINREAMDKMVNSKNESIGIRAGELALKATMSQSKLVMEYQNGRNKSFDPASLVVTEPFMADPVLREAFEFEVEKQRAEKAAREKARAERDALAKSADAAGQ